MAAAGGAAGGDTEQPPLTVTVNPADAEVVPLRVAVVDQQAGVVGLAAAVRQGAAGAGAVGGDFQGRGIAGEAHIVGGPGGIIGAADGDRQQGADGAAVAVGEGVGHRGVAGLAGFEVGKVGARLEAVGAVGIDGELTAVAAGDGLADRTGQAIAQGAAHRRDAEVVAVGITVVGQQAGIGGAGGAGGGHRQHRVFGGGGAVPQGHRAGIAGPHRDQQAGDGALAAVGHGVADAGGGGGAVLEAGEAAAGVKFPGAVGIDGELAAVAAAQAGTGGQALGLVGVEHLGDDQGLAVRVPVVQQQVGIDGGLAGSANAGGVIGHGQHAVGQHRAGIGGDDRRTGGGDTADGDRKGGGGGQGCIGIRQPGGAIGNGVADGGVAGLAFGQGEEIRPRVKAPGAVTLDNEAAAVAAAHRPARLHIRAGGALGAGADNPQLVPLRVTVVDQQAGGAGAGGIGGHTEGAVGGGAAVRLRQGRTVDAVDRHRQGGPGGAPLAILDDIVHRAAAGLAWPKIHKIAAGVEAVRAVGADDELAAAAAGQGAGGAAVDGGGDGFAVTVAAAEADDAETVAIRVCVIGQQAGIDAARAAGAAARISGGHHQGGVFRRGATVRRRQRVAVGQHRDREAGAVGVGAVRQGVGDAGVTAGARLEVVKVAARVETPGAAGMDGELAASGARHHPAAATAEGVEGGAALAGHRGDAEAGAGVRVAVVGQQAGGGIYDQVVTDPHPPQVGPGQRGVIGAGDGDREAGAGGLRAGPAAVGNGVADGGLDAAARRQAVKVIAGGKTPGAVGIEGEAATGTAAHGCAGGHRDAVVGGVQAGDGGDADSVAVRVTVVQQQVGVGAAAGAFAIRHAEVGILAGGAAVRQRQGPVGGQHGDGKGGAGVGPEGVGQGVGDGAVAAGAGGQVGEVGPAVGIAVRRRVKLPGAATIYGKDAAVAAPHRSAGGHRQAAAVGLAAAHRGDMQGVIVRVTVIGQQA